MDDNNPFVVKRSRRDRDRPRRTRPVLPRWLPALVPYVFVFAIWWFIWGNAVFFAMGFPPGAFVFFACFWLIAIVTASARSRRPGTPGDPTGTIVRPPPPAMDGWRGPMPVVVGGLNAPSLFGRARLGGPFGVMTLTGSVLTLGVRPRFLGSLFGVPALELTPADVDMVYPVGRPFGTRAIAVLPRAGRTWYVLTRSPEVPLAHLAAAGFPVQWEERRW